MEGGLARQRLIPEILQLAFSRETGKGDLTEEETEEEEDYDDGNHNRDRYGYRQILRVPRLRCVEDTSGLAGSSRARPSKTTGRAINKLRL